MYRMYKILENTVFSEAQARWPSEEGWGVAGSSDCEVGGETGGCVHYLDYSDPVTGERLCQNV